MDIRQMRMEDLDQVAKIDAAAFSDWWKREKGKNIELQPRPLTILQAYFEELPGGSFVAVTEKGEIVGYVFSHLLGVLGWFGPLGVSPAKQGEGIAKNLVKKVIEFQKNAGIKTIALETMPDTLQNLGLYIKLGFCPAGLRFRLTKSVEINYIEPMKTRIKLLPISSEIYKNKFSSDNRTFAEYNLARLLHMNEKFKLGKCVLVYRDNELLGFVYLQLSGRRGETGETYLKLLFLKETVTDQEFLSIISHCEKNSTGKLTIPIYYKYWSQYTCLMAQGYVLTSSCIRMFYNLQETDIADNGAIALFELSG